MQHFIEVIRTEGCIALQAGGDVKSCAQDVEECQGLRTAFFQCKKGQADPRSRIQGQKGY